MTKSQILVSWPGRVSFAYEIALLLQIAEFEIELSTGHPFLSTHCFRTGTILDQSYFEPPRENK